MKDILTCHSRRSTGVNNEISNGWIPFSCWSFGVLVLCLLALCHTVRAYRGRGRGCDGSTLAFFVAALSISFSPHLVCRSFQHMHIISMSYTSRQVASYVILIVYCWQCILCTLTSVKSYFDFSFVRFIFLSVYFLWLAGAEDAGCCCKGEILSGSSKWPIRLHQTDRLIVLFCFACT